VAPDSVNIIDAEARLVAGPGRDLVVNITAVTVIDDAASKEAGAFAVPAAGPANLARAYLPGMARMRQMSTDDVLLCDAASPIAKPAPLAPRPCAALASLTRTRRNWRQRSESGSTSIDHGAPGGGSSRSSGRSPRNTTFQRQRPARRAM